MPRCRSRAESLNRRRHCAEELIVLFVAALATRAHAQTGAEQWDQCNDPSSLENVIKACTEIIDAKHEPRDRLAMAFNNRGYAYTRGSQYDRAMADLDQSIRLDPRDPLAYNNRGYAWSRQNQHERAVSDFSRAIDLEPTYSAAFNNRCWSRAILGALTEALADCDESLKLRPDGVTTLDSRGLRLPEARSSGAGNRRLRHSPAAAAAVRNVALWPRGGLSEAIGPGEGPAGHRRRGADRPRRRGQIPPMGGHRTVTFGPGGG